MELVTRQTKANTAAERWKDQYRSRKYDQIYNKLVSLGKNPKPDDVDTIIGNTSWTGVHQCDECGSDSYTVVMVGEEPDYESNTAYMCKECIVRALALFETKEH